MKIVLAYSGGLDTSVIIPWLKENYKDAEVIAVAADVGQGAEELDGLEEKAINSGASKIFIEDLKDEFIEDFVWPTLASGAIYERKYLLGTSMARPVIAKSLVKIAKQEGAEYIAHGCTGKGNDQVRFELTIKALAPEMKIIAPWRIWDIRSRQDAYNYANERGIKIAVSQEKPYSMDRNVWHLSHEGSDLESPKNEPMDNIYMMVTPPSAAPDKPTYVEIEFAKGLPIAVDGKKMKPLAIVEHLNKVAGANGVGIDDLVENRLVGMKSRGVYENPAGRVLVTAHQELEYLTLDRDTLHFKEMLSVRFGELVYNGKWYSVLRESLSEFVNKTQEDVNGVVRMKLYKGNCTIAGMSSPTSLYDEELVTFEEDSVYNQADAEGFINLFGLQMKVKALSKKR